MVKRNLVQDLPLGFSAPPCPPAQPSLCKGKPELIKRWEESLSFVFKVSRTCALKGCVLSLVPLGAEAFLLSFFFFLPLLLSSITLLQWWRDAVALSSCPVPLYHVFISLKSHGLQDAFCSPTAPWCIFMGFLQLSLVTASTGQAIWSADKMSAQTSAEECAYAYEGDE